MMDIIVDNVSKSYGEQVVLKKLTVRFPEERSPASWARPGAERLRLCGFFLDWNVRMKGG